MKTTRTYDNNNVRHVPHASHVFSLMLGIVPQAFPNRNLNPTKTKQVGQGHTQSGTGRARSVLRNVCVQTDASSSKIFCCPQLWKLLGQLYTLVCRREGIPVLIPAHIKNCDFGSCLSQVSFQSPG